MKPGGVFEAADFAGKIGALEAKTAAPDFWNDSAAAEKVMSEIKTLKMRYEPWKQLQAEIEDLAAHLELANEAQDEGEAAEIEASLAALSKKYEKQNIIELMPGEVDSAGCFLTVHSGAGGTEACDWASMLYRMYLRWAERKGFALEEEDRLEAEGGLKSATVKIDGAYAYGSLKGESGVHRLVRISPFDANARRHTSFSSVYVFPVLDDSIEVDIKPEDLRVDTYRSGGAGGQHVNKTESAIRITHLPTNTVVTCQDEKSQIKNRERAMKVLYSRLYEIQRQNTEREYSDKRKSQVGTGDRSEKIRTYNFPQGRVTDHRVNFSVFSIDAFMDGEIIQMLDALSTADRNQKLSS